MLIKKCGLDAVKEVMPEEHMKLLTNIRKVSYELDFNLWNFSWDIKCSDEFFILLMKKQIKERRDKELASNSEESRSLMTKATTSRFFSFFRIPA